MQKTVLENGLTVATDIMKSVDTVALGVWCGTGARHEAMVHNGVAHMVEHMVFKGTTSRDALQISEEIENVGGRMNAYTGRETTAYYVHMLKDDYKLGLDMIADMLQHSTMPDHEIERERGVIIQEIGMYQDAPDDHIFDILQEQAFQNQAVGAPILGSVENIKSMPKDALFGYMKQHYTPSKMVVCAAGNIDHEAFVDQVSELFSSLSPDQERTVEQSVYNGGHIFQTRELEQSHILMGFKNLSYNDPDYFSMRALSSILGGGMSSRLFQEVREKRGLVYEIYAYAMSHSDSGLFSIYAGTNPSDLTDLVPVITDELLKSTQTITDVELARAKTQMKAGFLMSRESVNRRADQLGKSLLQTGECLDIDGRLKEIDALTTQDIMRTAKTIFTSTPTVAAIGQLDHLESYDKICARMAA
jgi:predicted Zn-dependent peptidase